MHKTKTNSTDFNGLYIKLYKQGLKLVAPDSHKLWAKKDLVAGKRKFYKTPKGVHVYWNPTHKCWFT